MTHRFTTTVEPNGDMDAAYVRVPIDIKKEYGKGLLKVQATFDGHPYSGSVVNMGVKDIDGNICYIIGITKAIRQKIGKSFGDMVDVIITPTLC